MKYQKWLDKNIDDLSNKTIIVTGATSGIGKFEALYFAYKGAKVILACRNLNKANNVKIEILNEVPNALLDIIQLDLSDFNSIDNFNIELRKKYSHIDILVNNAGVYFMPKELTKQGYEITMGTNYLGPYYLTCSILDLITNKGGKIINVSSIVHKHAKIDFNDFFATKVNRNKIYARSKLAITSFTYYLSEYLEENHPNTIAVCTHPGISATNILAPKSGGFSVWFSKLGSRFLKIFTHSPAKASLSVVIGVNKKIKNNDFYGPRFLEISGYPKKVKYNKNTIKYKDELIKKSIELTNKKLPVNCDFIINF